MLTIYRDIMNTKDKSGNAGIAKYLAMAVVIAAVLGGSYIFAGSQASGLVVMPGAEDTPGIENNGENTIVKDYAIKSSDAAIIAVENDAGFATSWAEKVRTVPCGENYKDLSTAVAKVVELNFEEGTAKCYAGTKDFEAKLNSYLINDYDYSGDLVYLKESCGDGLVSEYEALLKGGNTGLAGFEVADKSPSTRKAYAVEVFCTKVRSLGEIGTRYAFDIAFVDAESGKVYK